MHYCKIHNTLFLRSKQCIICYNEKQIATLVTDRNLDFILKGISNLTDEQKQYFDSIRSTMINLEVQHMRIIGYA